MEEMTSLLTQHGLALVFANVLLTQAGVPVPAIPILIVAGAFVSQGQIALAPLILVSVVASLVGDTLWYAAGRRYGYRILRTLCRIAIEPDSCVKQTETIFERWGAPSLMLAKYVPGFSTVAPPLAGTMPPEPLMPPAPLDIAIALPALTSRFWTNSSSSRNARA